MLSVSAVPGQVELAGALQPAEKTGDPTNQFTAEKPAYRDVGHAVLCNPAVRVAAAAVPLVAQTTARGLSGRAAEGERLRLRRRRGDDRDDQRRCGGDRPGLDEPGRELAAGGAIAVGGDHGELRSRLEQLAGGELVERAADRVRIEVELRAHVLGAGPTVAASPDARRRGAETVAPIGLHVIDKKLLAQLLDDQIL